MSRNGHASKPEPWDFRIVDATHLVRTEGSDRGVDCCGRVRDGTSRSLCFFMQAKAGQSDVTNEAVILDSGKFDSLRTNDLALYRQYLSRDLSGPDTSVTDPFLRHG